MFECSLTSVTEDRRIYVTPAGQMADNVDITQVWYAHDQIRLVLYVWDCSHHIIKPKSPV